MKKKYIVKWVRECEISKLPLLPYVVELPSDISPEEQFDMLESKYGVKVDCLLSDPE